MERLLAVVVRSSSPARTSLIGLVVAATLAACGEEGGIASPDAAPRPDAGAGPDFSAAPAVVRVGLESDGAGGALSTRVAADLRDQPAPSLYVVDPAVGACRAMHAETPFCEALCEPPSLCTAPDVCTPFPLGRSAGTIRIAAGDVAHELVYEADVGYPLGLGLDLAFPAGATLVARAPGADRPGFELSAPVPAPLLVTDLPSLQLRAGEPFVIRWTPADDPGARVRLTLLSDTAAHGQFKPSVIECDAPDGAGVITVPADLVTAHLDPANWGCGRCSGSSLARYQRSGDAALELVVENLVMMYLTPRQSAHR
jgi:hypothetical protein